MYFQNTIDDNREEVPLNFLWKEAWGHQADPSMELGVGNRIERRMMAGFYCCSICLVFEKCRTLRQDDSGITKELLEAVGRDETSVGMKVVFAFLYAT